MKNQQKMTCPSCQQGEIIYDTYALLQGVKFSCPVCHAQVGLAQESHQQVQETMQKFEHMKQNLGKQQ